MISILLSTYNGSAWLPSLLESLRAQDREDIAIVIRDDGSTDDTAAVIDSCLGEDDRIEARFGPNLGASRSFFELLRSLPAGTEYAAFCDQDDVWHADKISRAVSLMESQHGEGPAMYCSRLIIADGELNEITTTRVPRRGPSFANALVENIATGATMVINREAADLIIAGEPDPDRVVMYDWWIYLVISALGRVIFDDTPRIVSRQHGGNVVGLPFGRRYWRSKARFLGPGDRRRISAQAAEFARIFADRLTNGDRRLLDDFVTISRSGNLFRRARYALSGSVYRQRLLDDLFLRFRIKLGRI
jgi:glycosyltransferase involved in cell wall biosynthesis